MILTKRKTDNQPEPGSKYYLFQDMGNGFGGNGIKDKERHLDADGLLDYNERAAAKYIGQQMAKKEVIQNIVGLLTGEYFGQETEFAKDKNLVKQLQGHLRVLYYELGDSGVNKDGVDGALGAKTKTAIHNFEQDHVAELKAATKNHAEIQQAVKKGREK